MEWLKVAYGTSRIVCMYGNWYCFQVCM